MAFTLAAGDYTVASLNIYTNGIDQTSYHPDMEYDGSFMYQYHLSCSVLYNDVYYDGFALQYMYVEDSYSDYKEPGEYLNLALYISNISDDGMEQRDYVKLFNNMTFTLKNDYTYDVEVDSGGEYAIIKSVQDSCNIEELTFKFYLDSLSGLTLATENTKIL